MSGQQGCIVRAESVGQFVETAGIGIADVRALFQQLGHGLERQAAQFLW
jgi:hypothetical protein